MEWLAGGEWSQAFALTVDDTELVLRIGKHGTDFAKDAAVARLAGPELRVPAVMALGELDDWHYAVSSRARGTALDDLPGDGLAVVLPSLLTALDAIGDLELAGTVGYGNWAPDGRAPYRSWLDALLAIGDETARVPGWRAALVESGIGLEPVEAGLPRERLHAYLIHIGIDAIAYCAFRGRWDEVRANANTVLALSNNTPGEVVLTAR